MQDVRIRICASALLCFAAFLTLYGAAAALLWWLIFTPRLTIIHRVRPVIGMLIIIGIISVILQVGDRSGFSYFIRMVAILLIGLWLATEYRPGEFLHFGVWVGGNHIGFEFGLMAEMAMQSFGTLLADLNYIRMALTLKGIPVTIKNIIPMGTLLIHKELARAKDNAELLAVRGYRHGGTLKPVFIYERNDIIAGLGAVLVIVIAVLPFVNFLYFDIEVFRGLL
jgi:energy-coupling factor transport system permease protein